MKFVVDTNILFTHFWTNSTFAGMLKKNLTLFAPQQALTELRKYEEEIIRRAKLSKQVFEEKLNALQQVVTFVAVEEYVHTFPQAMELAKRFPESEAEEFINDIDFFALAISLRCAIWTNDQLFKKQSTILVFTTKEMVELLG